MSGTLGANILSPSYFHRVADFLDFGNEDALEPREREYVRELSRIITACSSPSSDLAKIVSFTRIFSPDKTPEEAWEIFQNRFGLYGPLNMSHEFAGIIRNVLAQISPPQRV